MGWERTSGEKSVFFTRRKVVPEVIQDLERGCKKNRLKQHQGFGPASHPIFIL